MQPVSAIRVAAIQMDAKVGQVEANLAHATELVEQAAAQGAQLVVLPELFSVGYEYTDRTYGLPEPLDGPTGSWIARTAHRLNLHLVGSFPAQMPEGTYIVAMLAAPDGRHWVYRKVHVAMWENCYFDRGAGPVIAETELGRIGLIVCWDQVFADLARVYQGRVDLLCIPSSPPTWIGALEDADGRVLARLEELHAFGNRLNGGDWFERAQELHARTASVPVVYAARCGTFHSPMPLGFPFLLTLRPREALRVLRAVGTHYWLRCPMMGRSCILNARGERLAGTGQDREAVLVATVQPGTPDPATRWPAPRGRSLVPGIPRSTFLFDDSMITWGRWCRRRHQERSSEKLRPFRPWFRIAALALLLVVFVALLQLMYPIGVDWASTFSQVDEHWRNPYVLEAFTSPPWLIALLPHAWLPTSWGNTINFGLNILVILAVVRRYQGGWKTLLLVFTSPPFFDLARTNNVDWIPLLSVLMPPMWGLPLLAIKPHTIGGIALVWWKRKRFNVLMFVPLVAVFILSLVIWGVWLLDLKPVDDTMWNFAPWPFGIPLGAYMLYRAYKSDNEILAAAATPFLTPYIAPYSVTIILALVGCKYRREAFLVSVGFWIYLIVEARRLALMG